MASIVQSDLDAAPVAERGFAASVDETGAIEEIYDGSGRRFLEGEPELIDLILAFIRCDRAEVRFTWICDRRRWAVFHLERPPVAADSERRALVEFEVTEPPHGLTGRELDVLTLVAGGLGNPEIAAHLESSPRTVSTHVERILRKLDQSTRAGAAGIAVQEGLLRLPVPGGGRSIGDLPVGQVDQERRGWGRPDGSDRPLESRRRARRPLLVGSALPLTGAAACEGVELRRGSALAIAEINAAGGIGGRTIQQLSVNADIFSAGGMTKAFETLVDAEVDAITTGFAFFEDPSSYRASNSYGCPTLSVMTSENQAGWVREDPGEFGHLFQVGPTETSYGPGFVRFLDSLVEAGEWSPGNRSLVFVETPVTGGQVTGPETIERCERSNWSIDSVLQVANRDADWEPVLTTIQRSNPAAVMLAHFLPGELLEFQRAFRRDPSECLVYGIYAPSTSTFLSDADGAGEGMLWSTLTGMYGDPISRRFATSYFETYGAGPGECLASVAYDQVNILAQAWAQVDNPRAFEAVSNRIRSMTHRGVNGAYSLGTDGQASLAFPEQTPDPSLGQAQLVFQIQDDRHRLLGPAPYGDAKFRLPPWMPPVRQPDAARPLKHG